MMLRIILGCLLASMTFQSMSQGLGLRAPGDKLSFIDSDTVRIIYAQGQYDLAKRVANIVHHMADEYPFDGTDKLRKISIQLQNRTDIPNGYVGLAPWRSEFYVSPPPGNFRLGSLPWTDLLAIHEFRHVQQRSASRTGLSAAAYYIFGEDFFSAVVNGSWPNWYSEGDAVISETALTQQGRGRLPSFINAYRAKTQSESLWKYRKARNGSFKDNIPSHYHLGFLLQNYGRLHYGQDFWDKVALESARYKGIFYPFSKAVKRVSGLSTRRFYEEAMRYYGDLWTKDGSATAFENAINVGHDRYEMHSYPTISSDGDLYVMISSFDRIPGIYKVANNEVDLIATPGIQSEDIFSVNGGRIAWAEYRLDSRWQREDYSTIIVADANGKHKKRLTHGQSYFSPALSKDGSRLAALYDDDYQHFQMHVLSTEDGEVQRVLPNPNNYYYSYAVWSQGDNAIIAALRDSVGQMAIGMQNVESGEFTVLTDWSFRVVGRPIQASDWIYFTMNGDLLDEIMRVNINNGTTQQMENGYESLYQPVIVPGGDELIFTQFTLDGNRLKVVDDVESRFRDRIVTTNAKEYLVVSESEGDILGDVPQRDYEENKYGLFKQPVFIHSWRPIFDDPIYSFEFQSLNVLQSISWNTGLQWNANSNDFGPYTEVALGMWYPEILLRYSGWTRDFVRQSDGRKFNWFEHSVSTGLRIPFQGFHGPFAYNGAVSSRIGRLMATGDVEYDLNFLSHRVYFQHKLRMAQKHPITRFGQSVDITLPHSIDSDTATQFQLKSDFTFPSPIRNHVIWLQFDYKRENLSNTYRFGDNFNYARGYEPFDADWNYRIGINYQLPLVYPDWGFAGLVYFNRIRANLFSDLSQASASQVTTVMNSVGAELIFDVKLMNIEPFTFGVRWSHLLQNDPNNVGVKNQWTIFVPTSRI